MNKFYIKYSLKQLIHTPIKTLLFFLLILLVVLLLVFSGAMMSQTSQRIAAAEGEFVTLGTVEQAWDSNAALPLWNSCAQVIESLDVGTYQELVEPESLDFDGAEYVQKPVMRPNYVAYLPDLVKTRHHMSGFVEISEFTVKEILDSTSMLVEIEDILYLVESIQAISLNPDLYYGDEVGEEIKVCLHSQRDPQDFQVGKRYIGALAFDESYTPPGDFERFSENDPSIQEKRMALVPGPFSTQVDADTHKPVEGAKIPLANNLWYEDSSWKYIQPPQHTASDNPRFSEIVYADEVTDDFYENGGRGEIWLNWAEGYKRDIRDQQQLPVVPVDDLQLFPSFHSKDAVITGGRAIMEEEFASGEKVCLTTRAFATQNHLKVGDKISLSLVYSMYGSYPIRETGFFFGGMYSPLNAQGQLYEPFWECEYEIVGLYDIPFDEDFHYLWRSDHEIMGDSIIIPARSVEASDENNIAYYAPMNADSTSFIIPNGTIEQFDKNLYEAVPGAEKLVITYNDQGYAKVVESLNSAKLSSMILFFVALFAALAIVVLLLYFFVAKEKKRTAIECSLGMTKKQCRISLVSGIVIVALTASILGSGGAMLIEKLDVSAQSGEELDVGYSLEYSTWAKNDDSAEVEIEVSMPWAVYVATPVTFTLIIAILAIWLVNRNLQIEPIYLLSTKRE